MSHPFGDLLSQHLHRKHGLSQSKLAAGILQDPTIIGKMCKGQRLNGPQARERVRAIIDWLHQQAALTSVVEANALLEAAGMASLQERDPVEAALLQQLGGQPAIAQPANLSRPPVVPAHAKGSRRRTERVGQGVLTPRADLPTSPIPLIGREKEVAAIQQRLSTPACRLLTLVGPGGIGKTRLAIEVAAARQQTYRDAVCFVNLQPVPSAGSTPMSDTAGSLPIAIADALQIALASAEPPQQQLEHYLADKALLLVLDNFEHLLDGAIVLAELLVAAPDVQLLVTSREVLNLREEWLFWVEGIAYPPPFAASGTRAEQARHNGDDLGSYGAVRLFQEYAQRLQPAFALDRNAAAVVRICQLSEGLPLALELAASWVKSLPCTEIAEELAGGLTILSTPLRNIPERHRTMRVVFDQSWKRLSEQEQTVFQRLSVFRGGFGRESAQKVAGATLPVLSVLVDRSLLKQDADGRYQIHELLRQYGEERLAESPLEERETRASYSTYFMAFLAERRFEFDGPGQLQAARDIADELENIRSAWRWAVRHLQVEAILPALRALFFFCQQRSRYLEGAETFADTVHNLESGEPQGTRGAALAECLTYFSWLCIRLSRLVEANAALVRARQLYDTLGILPPQYRAGDPITALMILALVQGDHNQALAWGEQARRQAELHNQPAALAFADYGLANGHLAQGNLAQAWSYAEQGLALNRSIGCLWFTGHCREILGQIAYVQEKLHVAKRQFEAAYAIGEEFNAPGSMAIALNHLGEVALAENELEVAQEHYERSLAFYREVNDRGGRAAATKGLGDVARRQGQYPLAETHYQQALQIALEIRYMPLVFHLLLASANLFLLTDRRQNGVELLAFVFHHPASDYRSKEEAHQVLEQLGEEPALAHEEITWQAASPQWAALLHSV